MLRWQTWKLEGELRQSGIIMLVLASRGPKILQCVLTPCSKWQVFYYSKLSSTFPLTCHFPEFIVSSQRAPVAFQISYSPCTWQQGAGAEIKLLIDIEKNEFGVWKKHDSIPVCLKVDWPVWPTSLRASLWYLGVSLLPSEAPRCFDVLFLRCTKFTEVFSSYAIPLHISAGG